MVCVCVGTLSPLFNVVSSVLLGADTGICAHMCRWPAPARGCHATMHDALTGHDVAVLLGATGCGSGGAAVRSFFIWISLWAFAPGPSGPAKLNGRFIAIARHPSSSSVSSVIGVGAIAISFLFHIQITAFISFSYLYLSSPSSLLLPSLSRHRHTPAPAYHTLTPHHTLHTPDTLQLD
jgi:hypothetical protein